MKNFSEYLIEEAKPSLVIFDIDDTLFHSSAKVFIKKGGKVIKSLTAAEYNEYQLQDGESFDFSDFKSAATFSKTAKPIKSVLNIAKQLLKRNSDVYIVTARADLDDKQVFLDVFRKNGVPIDKTHIFRAGNIKAPSGPIAKAKIIDTLLKRKDYGSAYMFDDHKDNLRAFDRLKKKYGGTSFHSMFVGSAGDVRKI